MTKFFFALAVCIAFALGAFASQLTVHAPVANAAAETSPAQGFTLHIDAERHFGDAHPTEIAHHWCKGGLAGGLTECQIYDSDAPNAHLVAVETIVPPEVYQAFNADEKALWHWHKTEVAKVHATLPGMSPEEQQKVVAAILPTYGKVWVLWDPATTNSTPTGKPWVSIVH